MKVHDIGMKPNNFRSWSKRIFVLSVFYEFEPRLKSTKTRFQMSAGLNLETLSTILSKTNHIWAVAQMNDGSGWMRVGREISSFLSFGRAKSISADHVKSLGDNFKASVRGKRILAAPEIKITNPRNLCSSLMSLGVENW